MRATPASRLTLRRACSALLSGVSGAWKSPACICHAPVCNQVLWVDARVLHHEKALFLYIYIVTDIIYIYIYMCTYERAARTHITESTFDPPRSNWHNSAGSRIETTRGSRFGVTLCSGMKRETAPYQIS